jgi:predicted HTH transcriptional regulator
MVNNSGIPTRLSKEEIKKVRSLVLRYLQDHDHITNGLLRKLSGITYDQAIHFFAEMIKEDLIERVGITSGIRYILRK